MLYNMKKYLTSSALSLLCCLSVVNICSAQGVVSLSESAKMEDAKNEIPDEISLFGDETAEIDIIAPAKSTKAVQQAKPIAINAKSAPKKENNTGVKSAAQLFENSVKNSNAKKLETLPKKVSPLAEEKPVAIKNIPAPINNKKENLKPSPAAQLTNNFFEDIDDSVFKQMSELEKQTAILNLELKKQQVKNSIESLKAVQEKARREENERIEAEKRKAQEWENNQKKELLQEQQKLKELEIAFEKTRQEKILNAYKNKMMEETQNFISSREDTFKELAELKAERQSLISDFKGRFLQLTKLADEATTNAVRVREKYAKTISDLQTQISILKARLDASEKPNPFAEQIIPDDELSDTRLNEVYAIMEIRGQGEDMAAKLINETGVPFLVKVGTALQTGHIVDEISPTYLRADKNGKKDYLYFSAGGILEREPIQNANIKIKSDTPKKKKSKGSPAIMTNGIPGVAAEMTVR